MHAHAHQTQVIKSEGTQFPPAPPSQHLMSRIINGFSREVDPLLHSECGCAVCGKLVTTAHMV
ncbi:hypothetical protein FOMPIDRAFT_65092, partial [Fomitopsis schrenkii]